MTQDKEIEKFISDLFLLYPLGKEFSSAQAQQAKVLQFKSTLESPNKQYNYQKLLNLISQEYKYKTTPELAWIIERRNAECEIKKEVEHKVFCVFFENGTWIPFTYCDFGIAVNNLKNGLENRYGKIKATKLYPKGTTIQRGGKDGVFKIFPPQGETQILDLNN